MLLDEYDQGNITKEGVREEVDTFMFEVGTLKSVRNQTLRYLLKCRAVESGRGGGTFLFPCASGLTGPPN